MTQKQEGKAFRLVEMYDSMKDAIENAKKIKNQHGELIEIIEASEKKEEFKGFVEELNEQVKNLETQIEKLEKRLSALEFVNSYTDKEIIENIIEALGMFE